MTPDKCEFLQAYRQQIFSLNRDEILQSFEKIGQRVKAQLGFREEPEIVLIVHEAPSNSCSERRVLQEFFECDELKLAK